MSKDRIKFPMIDKFGKERGTEKVTVDVSTPNKSRFKDARIIRVSIEDTETTKPAVKGEGIKRTYTRRKSQVEIKLGPEQANDALIEWLDTEAMEFLKTELSEDSAKFAIARAKVKLEKNRR